MVGHDMTKAKLLGIAALLALSVWIGFEIDPDRDWIAWLFIAALPVAIVALATILHLRSVKKGGNNEH